MATDINAEIIKIAAEWVQRNERIFIREQARKRIGITRSLKRSMSHRVKTNGDTIEAYNQFLRRGRFVDMGVGKGVKVKQRSPKLKRRAKKWYSPAWYGRLNDLQGVVQTQMNEEALNIIRTATDGNQGR